VDPDLSPSGLALSRNASTEAGPRARRPDEVLFVEDDAPLRAAMLFVLAAARFRGRSAVDGSECLAVYDAGPEHIGVVLLDLSMSPFTAEWTLEALHLRTPLLPIILMGAPMSYRPRTDVAFLRKPFLVGELYLLVRRALAQA
jgi:DNA-binding NtrC family response regulator